MQVGIYFVIDLNGVSLSMICKSKYNLNIQVTLRFFNKKVIRLYLIAINPYI